VFSLHLSGAPDSKCLETRNILISFFFFLILEQLHIHNGMSGGWDLKTGNSYMFHTHFTQRLKVVLYNTFSVPVLKIP
jgi:hypothetical protein